MTKFEKALRECERWGVEVKIVDELTSERLNDEDHEGAPTTESLIHVPTRTIIWVKDECGSFIGASALLHEMSHCIIAQRPMDADEVGSGMLAIEYEAHRRLKLDSWSEWMSPYLGETCPRHHDFRAGAIRAWPDLAPCCRGAQLKESRVGGERRGLLTSDGRPTYKRERPINRPSTRKPYWSPSWSPTV